MRVVHQVTYVLEPYLSGVYTIPAMTVTYRDTKNKTETTQLVTEEIQIEVQSLLGPGTEEAEIKDIKPPLSLPPDRVKQFMVIGLAVLLAALAVAAFFYWKKKGARKTPAVQVLRPEEIALQELEKLLADNLLARRRGQVLLLAERGRSEQQHPQRNQEPTSHSDLLGFESEPRKRRKTRQGDGPRIVDLLSCLKCLSW